MDNISLTRLQLLDKLLETYTAKDIASRLNIATGTVNRWFELRNVPQNYEFELLKMANMKIDYSKYSTKEKDQFFTPVETARECFAIFCETIQNYGENPNEYTYVEPSAGSGSFLHVLPESTIAIDIEPRHPKVVEQDYLDWLPDTTNNVKYIVIGNPPFGLRGQMALKFINHSNQFADYVCFILPQLFESDGKGVPRKRVEGYNLIYSGKLNSDFHEPNNKTVKINTIYQIWSKYHKNEEHEIKDYTNENMKIYSVSYGENVATRHKNMIGKCDIYIPLSCFGKHNMRCYESFDELPAKKGYGIVFHSNKEEMKQKMLDIDWGSVAFLSTNSAYNLRSSQIYALFDVV